MPASHGRVTVHMVASLDGFIARKDGAVDWLETNDTFPGGETLDEDYVRDFLKSIDCYVMGSRTYETALGFAARGFGWSYGDKPVFVLTRRDLPLHSPAVELVPGDLQKLIEERLKPHYANIWIAGGGALSAECLRLGLVDEVRYTFAPVLIGEGVPFFDGLASDVPLHLMEVKAYRSGLVALRHQVLK